MRNLVSAGGLLAAVVLSGCLHRESPVPNSQPRSGPPISSSTNAPADAQKLIVTPAPGLSGKVSWVDSSLRFVVLTFPVGEVPAVNLRLHVYRAGLKTGELNVTGPQSDDSIVADVVAGEAEVGDEVREK